MYTATVRFPDSTAARLKAAAKREGVTFAQYLRDAAIAQMVFDYTSREIDELRERVAQLEAQLDTGR